MWLSTTFISTPEKIDMDLERQAVDFKFNFSLVKVVSYFCFDLISLCRLKAFWATWTMKKIYNI